MKRPTSFTFIVKILAVVMIATTLLAAFPILNVSAANLIITLDPGHGAHDPGNQSATAFGGQDESYDNYWISYHTKARLEQYAGVTVYMTRGENEFKELAERVQIAKNYKSDAIVSIHTNSATATANGVEIWVPNNNYRADIAKASENCANTVLAKYIAATGLRNRGLKTKNGSSTFPDGSAADSLSILRNGKIQGIPVVMLIETAFASNQGDYQKVLSSDAARQRAGYAIADGLAAYYGLSPKGGASLPGVDVPVVPTAPSYYSCVDHINGVGPNGTPNYNNLNGTAGTPATVDAVTSAVPSDNKLSLGGWMGVDGGTSHYVYSVDNGATWKNATGGYDGEPVPNHYSSLGFSNATKMGMFHKDTSPIVADLSAYAGQKVNVTFAAVSAKDNSFILPFLKVTNYTVSGTAAPVAPSLVASCVDANSIDGADTADKSVAISVTAGQTVGVRGWAGYNVSISKFGYYFDGNSAATVWTTDPGAETEAPVLGAGGSNARRCHIQASTAGLSAGTHSVNFVLQLSDGSVVNFHSYSFIVKAASTPEPEHTCSFGTWRETKPATCTESGVRTRTCSCGNAETAIIPVKAHTEGTWIVDTVAKPGVDGFKHIECTVCHLTLKTELIPALPVVADPDVTTKEPDVTTKEPEATEPEATEPEATESEATESEATESEATESEATELEATEKEPEITKPEAKPPEEKSSCNSTVSGALAIVALTTAAGALCLARKKED